MYIPTNNVGVRDVRKNSLYTIYHVINSAVQSRKTVTAYFSSKQVTAATGSADQDLSRILFLNLTVGTDYSDVWRRTPHRRIFFFMKVIDPQHRYSNKAEGANQEIYDDFKLKKHVLTSMVYIKIF